MVKPAFRSPFPYLGLSRAENTAGPIGFGIPIPKFLGFIGGSGIFGLYVVPAEHYGANRHSVRDKNNSLPTGKTPPLYRTSLINTLITYR